MKKRLLTLALSLLVGTALAQTDVTFMAWGSPEELTVWQTIADEFNKANPDVNVSVDVSDWEEYFNKLQTLFAGGTPPDVFAMDAPLYPDWRSRGVLKNLQPYLDAEPEVLDGFYPVTLQAYETDEGYFGLPRDFQTIVLYYNKDMFDAAGLEYPTADWTWNDLKTAAQALTTDGNWGFASTTADQSGFWNFVYANGGEVLNDAGTEVRLADPAACDAVTYLYSFVQEGLSPDGATMTSVDPWTQLFPGGRVGMVVGGSWLARTYADAEPNIDVAPLPRAAQQASVIHGLANVVWSRTEHPDKAWAFAKFLGSDAAATLLAQSGTVIPAYTGFQETWVESIPEMNLQVFMDAAEYAVPYPTTTQGSEWQNRVVEVLGEVWNGNVPIEGACEQVATAANAALGR